jgi:hypothetical protein
MLILKKTRATLGFPGPPNYQGFGKDGAWTFTTAVFTRSLPRTMIFVLRTGFFVLQKEIEER